MGRPCKAPPKPDDSDDEAEKFPERCEQQKKKRLTRLNSRPADKPFVPKLGFDFPESFDLGRISQTNFTAFYASFRLFERQRSVKN